MRSPSPSARPRSFASLAPSLCALVVLGLAPAAALASPQIPDATDATDDAPYPPPYVAPPPAEVPPPLEAEVPPPRTDRPIAAPPRSGFGEENQCTTTWTVTTRCTGDAAPHAVPAPAPAVVPPPAYNYAPPAWYATPPLLPPLRAHKEMRRRIGLMAAGIAVFGASYTINAMMAVLGGGGLAVPIVGPLFYLNGDLGGVNAYLVFDTLVQAAGFTMMLAGALTKKPVLVYDRAGTRVSLAPYATRDGSGMALVGTF